MSSASASSISSAGTSASSDWWCGGSGQVKWLTDVVAGGKSMTDWCLVLVLALSLVLVLVLALTDDVVAVGKSNDWLMWWQGGKSNDWLMQSYSNTLCLVLVLALSLVVALALTDDVVAVGKSNDWLMWWQWASQMTDWCGDMVTLYV